MYSLILGSHVLLWINVSTGEKQETTFHLDASMLYLNFRNQTLDLVAGLMFHGHSLHYFLWLETFSQF